MSSSAHPLKTNDASILRKFELSKKEENLKNKLFNKPSQKKTISPKKSTSLNQPPANQRHSNQQDLQNSTNSQQNVPNPFKMAITPDTDIVLDAFLKDMENEFKEISKSMFIDLFIKYS